MTFTIRSLDVADLSLVRQLFETWRQGDGVVAPPASDETLRRLTMESLALLITLHDAYHLRQATQWRESYTSKNQAA